MSAWLQAAVAGIDSQTCIKCKFTYGISEFISLNGKQLCKMCGDCRKIHREADREYTRKRRERQREEDRMNFLQTHGSSFPSSSRGRPISQPAPAPAPAPAQIIPQAPPMQRQMAFQYSTSLPPHMPISMPQYMPVPSHMTMNPWGYVIGSSYPTGSHYAGTPEYNAPPSLPGSSSLPYFICLHCKIARSTKLIYESICVYCLGFEQKYCMYCDHEEDRRNFYDRTGVEQVRCNNCREDDEDEQFPETQKETAPESSDDSDESDTDLSDASSDIIQLNAPVNAQKEPQRVVQTSTQPDVILLDAPSKVQKDPQEALQKDPQETVQKDPQETVQKDPQETVQANTKTGDTPKEVQPDMVLVDVRGDDIVLSDVPGDVQEIIKGDTQANTQGNIHGNPQVVAQADTANLKTGEEEIPHKKSPEPSEPVKIKIENDDSIQLASISRISDMPVGGDKASDPILID